MPDIPFVPSTPVSTAFFTERATTQSKKAYKENVNLERKVLIENQTKYIKRNEQNTKECAKSLKQIYKLKQEKLEVYKKHIKNKQEYRLEKLKLKKMNLELKLKRLDMELRIRNE